MQWTKPDFQEITLGMEVTGYVNTDERGDTDANRQPAPVSDASRKRPDIEDASAKR